MVNGASTFGIDPTAGDPLRALALSYAPRHARSGVMALFALDATLASIVARAREPVVAQMRLAWWDEALRGIDIAPPPAQPILRVLASDLVPHEISGARLASMIDGWERLLDSDRSDDLLQLFAQERGGRLFTLAAERAGATDPQIEQAGTGWALATLGEIDAAAGSRGEVMAQPMLDRAVASRWSPQARFLGGLAHAARHPASPVRVARLAWHRLTGR